ncbi:MAG: aspartyl-phosphate phosphatase Spo0E family protein [Dehalobacterium sp.]
MNIKDKIEIARNILNNAIQVNINKETIQAISRKMDKYIVEYYHENRNKKGDDAAIPCKKQP